MRQRGVGADELMIVDLECSGLIEVCGPEICGRFQRHVAVSAFMYGPGRVIETARAVPGYAGQVIGVLVILAAQPLVVIQLRRQMHLVATAAETRLPVQGFEKGFPVEGRLGLHQLLIDPLQKPVAAERERVMLRRFDGVISVAARAVDFGDGMATGAGNARTGQGIVRGAKFRIIKRAAEKGNRIVAAGTKAGKHGYCHRAACQPPGCSSPRTGKRDY